MVPFPKASNRVFYGWVVVGVSCVILMMMFGVRSSFGVFFKSIEGEFQLSRMATSGIFSAYMAFSGLFAMVGGWLLDRYGPRRLMLLSGIVTLLSLVLTGYTSSPWQLFITYSVLLALGTGGGYIVLVATASKWFVKRRGLAVGVTGAGVGLGTMVMAPFAATLIAALTWRMAFVVMGLVAGLVIVALSILLVRSPAHMGLLPDGLKSGYVAEPPARNGPVKKPRTPWRLVVGDGNFWFTLFAWMLFSLCLSMILAHIVPHATDVGISNEQAALVLGVIGGVNLVGRIIIGGISDRIGRRGMAVMSALLQAGAVLWLIWTRSLWGFYLFAIVFGIGYGGLGATTDAMVGDYFGLTNIGVFMGVFSVSWQVGATIGPLIGGMIFDASNSYTIAFWVGASVMFASSVLLGMLRRRGRAG